MLVTGLCAQVAYTITLTASNATGTGLASAPSNPVVALPGQVPSAPLITLVLNRNASLSVSWSAPDDSGGSALTGYALSATAGSQTVTLKPTANATQATVTGLTNGTHYAVQLAASNAVGSSSSATASGTPSAPYAPRPPQEFSVLPNGSGGAVATWTAPADTGGDALTGYTVTYEHVVPNSTGTGWVPAPGATPKTATAGASATTLTVATLTPAAAYWSFAVNAVSAAGTGQTASTASPVSPTTQLAAKSVVLTAATMSALTSDTGGVLTWAAPAPAQVAALTVGQVLVGGIAPAAPNGVLATVQSISQPTSGTYVVTTTGAALSDAFTDASLAKSTNSLSGAGGSFRATTPGVRRVSPNLSVSTTATLSVDLKQNLGKAKVDVKGELDITPTVSVDLTLNSGFLGIPDGATLSASGSVAASASFTVNIGGTAKWQIGEIDGTPFDIQVGPVPVIIEPKVPVYLQVDGSIGFVVTASVTVGAAISWTSSNAGTLSTQNLSKPGQLSAQPEFGAAVSGEASVGVTVQPELLIYDVTGPDISAELLLDAKVNFGGSPFLTLTPEVQIQAGWNINFFIFNATLNVTLTTLAFPQFVIQTPPPVTLVVSPADPNVTVSGHLTFTAARSDGGTHPLTWSLVGGVKADTISSAGVFTPAAPAGRSLTVSVVDSTGLVAQTIVTVEAAPFDAPGNLNATLNGPGVATFSWTAPANTGGSPLAGYVVATQPATTTHTLSPTATSTVITGLRRATTYVVEVYATDASGLESAPAATTLQAPDSAWSTVVSANKSSSPNMLNGVACVGAADCWAVGGIYTANNNVSQTLIEHNTGSGWVAVTSPSPAGGGSALDSVACVNANDCWAVGSTSSSTSGQALIEQYTGSTWAVVNGPAAAFSVLNSVTCLSATDCWAVGNSGPNVTPLTEQYTGSAWTIVSSPIPPNFDGAALDSVTCPSASECWAVGWNLDSVSRADVTLIEENTGSGWKLVSSPNNVGSGYYGNELLSVDCISGGDCWAVGQYFLGSGNWQTLTEHYSAAAWTIVSSPNPGSAYTSLTGVTCTNANDCWAVGATYPNNYGLTLIEQNTGSGWVIVGSPNVGYRDDFSAVTCVNAADCVAVGSYGDSATSPAKTMVAQYGVW